MTIYIKASELKIGDKIMENRTSKLVRKLSFCSGKGVPKIHVNDADCYDTLNYLTVARG